MKITEGKRLAAILGAYIGLFSLCVLVPKIHSYLWLIALLPVIAFAAAVLFREKRRNFLLKKSILVLMMSISVVSACARGMAFLQETEHTAIRYTDGAVHKASGYIAEISYEESYGSRYRAISFS